MTVLLAAFFLFSLGIRGAGDLNLVVDVRSQIDRRLRELDRLFVIHREHEALAVRSLPQASRHVMWLLRLGLLAGDAEPAPAHQDRDDDKGSHQSPPVAPYHTHPRSLLR